MGIGIHGACVIDDKLWFSLSQANGLCTFDLKTECFEYISRIPEEDFQKEFLYSDIKLWGDVLVMTPMNAKNIALYNVKTGIFEMVPFDADVVKRKLDYLGYGSFYSSKVVKDSAYFIPYYFPAIVKLDLRTERLTYLENWINKFIDEYDRKYIFFREDIVSDSDDLIFVSLFYNAIVKCNTNDMSISVVEKNRSGRNEGYLTIIKVNNMIVVTRPKERAIKILDNKFNIVNSFCYESYLKYHSDLDFIGSIQWGEYIYFVPYACDVLVRIDISLKEIELFYSWNEPPFITRFWIWNNCLYCVGVNGVMVFETRGNIARTINTERNARSFWSRAFNKNYDHIEIVHETENIGLDNLIDVLRN